MSARFRGIDVLIWGQYRAKVLGRCFAVQGLPLGSILKLMMAGTSSPNAEADSLIALPVAKDMSDHACLWPAALSSFADWL